MVNHNRTHAQTGVVCLEGGGGGERKRVGPTAEGHERVGHVAPVGPTGRPVGEQPSQAAAHGGTHRTDHGRQPLRAGRRTGGVLADHENVTAGRNRLGHVTTLQPGGNFDTILANLLLWEATVAVAATTTVSHHRFTLTIRSQLHGRI
ncbi:hypothetical protein GCM10022198_25780 [Klugiella xanthotipulae]